MDGSGQKEQEFLNFFDTHVDALFSYCFSRLPDHLQAQELVEKTFKRAWDQVAEGKHLGIGEFYQLLDESVNKRMEARGVSLSALLEYFSGSMKHSS